MYFLLNVRTSFKASMINHELVPHSYSHVLFRLRLFTFFIDTSFNSSWMFLSSSSLFFSACVWHFPHHTRPHSVCVCWCMCILIRSQRGDFVIMFILIGCAITPLITLEPTLRWTMAVCSGGVHNCCVKTPPSAHTHTPHMHIHTCSQPLYLRNIIPKVASLMSFPCPGLD